MHHNIVLTGEWRRDAHGPPSPVYAAVNNIRSFLKYGGRQGQTPKAVLRPHACCGMDRYTHFHTHEYGHTQVF